MNCLICNKETKNPKFCSRSCSATSSNLVSPKRRLGKNRCKGCNIPTRNSRLYCDICWKKDYTLEEVKYNKLPAASYYSQVRNRARVVAKNLPKSCRKCGYDKHVEVCHIKAISSWPSDTLLSTINSLDNLILLCPNCHWEFDNNLWDVSELIG